ncbi:hypothetical protein O6H91_04G013100 [Diphasiastrum complanatum]|uniref:Uncharacterized protein n=1 Tax=Diphasiastrum complanatum TaxID=34168 RepID=A0ACC2DUB7_DIPCM|nr:hypothetical protein O6H91_04G013100 [Diphasiastrum complanatum]
MLEVLDRRITRSLSAELQARAQLQAPIHGLQGGQTQQIAGAASHSQGQDMSRFAAASGNAEEFSRGGSMAMDHAPILRNCSEEILLRSFMDAQMAPANEGMGFLGPPQVPRINSEELFNSWLSTTESPGTSGLPPFSAQHRPPQPSRKMSNELAALLGPQSGIPIPPFDMSRCMEFNYNHNSSVDAVTKESNHMKPRNGVANRGFQHNHPSLQLINWFNQSQIMTRSRSSELRQKYLALQDGQTIPPSAATLQWLATQGTYELNQAVASLGAFTRGLANGSPDSASPTSHQTSSIPSSPAKLPLQEKGDSVSAVVSMLKGSLERKKQSTRPHQAKNAARLSQLRPSAYVQEESYNQMQAPQLNNFQSTEAQQQLQQNQNAALSASLLSGNEQFQSGMLALHAQSPSDSSGGAPGLSAGAANSEGPCNSGPTASIRNNFMNPSGHSRIVDQPLLQSNGGNQPSPTSNGPSSEDVPYEGALQAEFQKRQAHLSQPGSLTSCKSGFTIDVEGSSKKRRVERKRMMTEAKGRGYTPMMPSDLQAALKRCDTLEKEVRSLKLNLSFMNRKDSEQTKQIEDLETRNEELLEEKNQLLEELAHFNSSQGSGRVKFRSI